MRRPFDVPHELYPFDDRWIEHRGAPMHYVDVGSGTPVVMLHGNPTWSFLYRDVIGGVSDVARCIAVDYPGFGFSGHPAGYGYTAREHAAAVEQLIDTLDLPPFLLVVQDWGGPIGLSIAVKRPERIAGIVLLNTWAWPATASMKAFSHVMGDAPGRWMHRRHNFFARVVVPRCINRAERKTPEVLRAYTDPFPTPESRIGTWVFPREIRVNQQWLGDIERGLAALRDKPIEMVWAMDDPAFGHQGTVDRWRRIFPDAPLDVIPEANHFIQEDAPERVAAAVRRVVRTNGNVIPRTRS